MSLDEYLKDRRKLLAADFGDNRNIVTADLNCSVAAFQEMVVQLGPEIANGYLLAMLDMWDALEHILNRERKGFNLAETPSLVRSKATEFNEHLEQFLKSAFENKLVESNCSSPISSANSADLGSPN